MEESILPQVERLVAPIIEDMGYELVEVAIAGVGNATVVRIFVHREGGITVDELAKISGRISEALDREDFIHHKYFLEVSSPGLDRKLVSVRDFQRVISDKVRVLMEDGTTFEGKLVEATAEFLILNIKGREKKIPFSKVNFGKVIF